MRRERIIRGIAVLSIAASVGFTVAVGAASAATPAEICAAIASGSFNAANYSGADLAAYQQALQNDTTIQGYCSPIVFVPGTTSTITIGGTTTTLPAQTTTVINGTTTTVPAVTTTVINGTTTTVPVLTTTVLNGTTTVVNVPSGGAGALPEQGGPTSGVLGATAGKAAPSPAGGVAGARKSKQGAPSASPLGATKHQGSLPFTGAELTVFAIVGLALLAGGLLLRLTAREKGSRA